MESGQQPPMKCSQLSSKMTIKTESENRYFKSKTKNNGQHNFKGKKLHNYQEQG